MTLESELIAAAKARRRRPGGMDWRPPAEAKPAPAQPVAVLLAPEPPKPKPRPRTMRDIVRIVAEFYHVSPRDITGDRRFGPIVRPRQVAMYFGRNLLRITMARIGRELGGRDHTTVFCGIEKIEQRARLDMGFAGELQELERIIRGEWNDTTKA